MGEYRFVEENAHPTGRAGGLFYKLDTSDAKEGVLTQGRMIMTEKDVSEGKGGAYHG